MIPGDAAGNLPTGCRRTAVEPSPHSPGTLPIEASSERSKAPMPRWVAPVLLAVVLPLTATASDLTKSCLGLGDVTAFTPRGEVYVEVVSACTPGDFAAEDPIVTHVEVLVSDLPPVTRDVIVHGDRARERETHVFSNLNFATGDPILVRLVRFGEIQGLRSLKAP